MWTLALTALTLISLHDSLRLPRPENARRRRLRDPAQNVPALPQRRPAIRKSRMQQLPNWINYRQSRSRLNQLPIRPLLLSRLPLDPEPRPGPMARECSPRTHPFLGLRYPPCFHRLAVSAFRPTKPDFSHCATRRRTQDMGIVQGVHKVLGRLTRRALRSYRRRGL